MKINYLEGDATKPVGEGTKIIVHCCNDVGAWGAGFVLALSSRWENPERSYKEWFRNRNTIASLNSTAPFKQGQIQVVSVEDDVLVCNLIGQSGTGKTFGLTPVRYGAITEGLVRLREFMKNEQKPSIHMPRMGCGLAGGRWERIEAILNYVFGKTKFEINVYDYKG